MALALTVAGLTVVVLDACQTAKPPRGLDGWWRIAMSEMSELESEAKSDSRAHKQRVELSNEPECSAGR